MNPSYLDRLIEITSKQCFNGYINRKNAFVILCQGFSTVFGFNRHATQIIKSVQNLLNKWEDEFNGMKLPLVSSSNPYN